jgi:hypothetical protein
MKAFMSLLLCTTVESPDTGLVAYNQSPQPDALTRTAGLTR